MRGTVYLVYPNNNSVDGSDIVFQKSTDGGRTFSAPLLINSRPGEDRAQWFPWVTVDNLTGRVSVFYYDQGIATSGDLSEVTYTFSDDGGQQLEQAAAADVQAVQRRAQQRHGSAQPRRLQSGAFRSTAFFAAFALASRPPLGFVDGQPDVTLTGIDATVREVSALEHSAPYASLNVQSVKFTDSGGNGFIDPGETANLKVSLTNFVTNPLNSGSVRSPLVALSSNTPGVTVLTERACLCDNSAGSDAHQPASISHSSRQFRRTGDAH